MRIKTTAKEEQEDKDVFLAFVYEDLRSEELEYLMSIHFQLGDSGTNRSTNINVPVKYAEHLKDIIDSCVKIEKEAVIQKKIINSEKKSQRGRE
jgi:hypothetical protein